MPSPAKTTDAEIIGATRRLLEKHGRDGFTLADVAKAVGIRAPSLYKRFENRDALVTAVEVELWNELGQTLVRAMEKARGPVAQLTALAHAHRAFAKAQPNQYALMYDAGAEQTEEGHRARAQGAAPILQAFEALVGKRHALDGLRVLAPFLHGFVVMELAGTFRFGGSVDAAFDQAIATILNGLSKHKE